MLLVEMTDGISTALSSPTVLSVFARCAELQLGAADRANTPHHRRAGIFFPIEPSGLIGTEEDEVWPLVIRAVAAAAIRRPSY
jgi:hypothetical protein